jgi:hypothetical protein
LEIRVQLTREAQIGHDTRHYNRNKVVKITICWGGKLYSAEVDIVKCLVVNTGCFVSVLHELVNGKRSAIKLHIAAVEKMPNWEINKTHLNDCVRNLGTRNNEICAHPLIEVLLTNLRNEEGTQTGTSMVLS